MIMLQRKKKPVQYFFVDINDPDYYKRIKVARACIDCRKRKSKCDIGKPGSGPCSNCRKHNKTCEFASSTMLPSPLKTTPSCQQTMESRSGVEYANGRFQPVKRRRAPIVRRHDYSTSTSPSTVYINEVDHNSSDESDSQSLMPSVEITKSSRAQSSVTREQTHFFGRLQIDLPVLCLQHEQSELPITPPLSFSSKSVSSSAATTPSPPLHTDYADGYMYPWHSTSANFDKSPLHSVSLTDPIEISHQSSPSLSLINSIEHDLFHLYSECIHSSFPVVSKSILNHSNSAPLCLRYAILALSSLYYYDQQQPSMMYLSQEYYNETFIYLNDRGINDLISAQTLLILYKYHETLGQPNEPLLERASSILEQYSRTMDIVNSYQDEWLYRLQWIVYLCHFNGSSNLDGTWQGPPMIRLPSLLPSEQHDQDQVKAIAQLLDTIHTANIYTSAMQILCVPPDDHWTCDHPLETTSL